MYVLQNQRTNQFARYDCAGEHDGRFTDPGDITDAKEFDTFGAAADYGQNFGDDWHPMPLFNETLAVDMRRAISREIPSA